MACPVNDRTLSARAMQDAVMSTRLCGFLEVQKWVFYLLTNPLRRRKALFHKLHKVPTEFTSPPLAGYEPG